jgi:glyoxylase-like metal-dependent hydrolase (beta-lactamase superfamily II)
VEPEKALFPGDIFGYGLIPLTRNLRADTATLLDDTYRRLIDFNPEVVVPGHGPLCTVNELKRWLEYFHWLQDEIARLCEEGLDDTEIVRRMVPPEDMKSWWRFLKWKHADSVAKVLKAVRKGWLKP